MRQNLHGLAAEEERGDAATAMRGHGDEVAAAGTSGFDDGLIRFPMLYFHHLTRDADLLGLLLCLGEARLGLSIGTSRVFIWRVVRLRKAPQYGEWLDDREHGHLRPETLGERDALLHSRAGERRTVGGDEYVMVHGDLSCQSAGMPRGPPWPFRGDRPWHVPYSSGGRQDRSSPP